MLKAENPDLLRFVLLKHGKVFGLQISDRGIVLIERDHIYHHQARRSPQHWNRIGAQALLLLRARNRLRSRRRLGGRLWRRIT